MGRLTRYLISAVIVLWASNLFILFLPKSERGVLGDMFGVANSLFSGLAFVGIILTLYMQTKQHEVGTIQQFENTFFQLLGLHQQIISDMDLRLNTNKTIKGRDCFRYLFTRYSKMYNDANDKTNINVTESINAVYFRFYEKRQDNLAHYFQTLYNMVKYVDENNAVTDKKKYTNIVRAQLSVYELGLLFYNCTSDLGKDKFKPLIEKYSLLKNMPKGILIMDSHIQLYHKEAYGYSPQWTNSHRFELDGKAEFDLWYSEALEDDDLLNHLGSPS